MQPVVAAAISSTAGSSVLVNVRVMGAFAVVALNRFDGANRIGAALWTLERFG